MNRASNEMGIIAPGYTHLQRAQPVRWSQFLLSYLDETVQQNQLKINSFSILLTFLCEISAMLGLSTMT